MENKGLSLDKIRKIIYNEIVKVLLCTLCIWVILSFTLPGARGAETTCISLVPKYHELQGLLSVELYAPREIEFDALLLTLEYDRELLSFTSAQNLREDEQSFTCSLSDTGKIKLLFDRVEFWGNAESAENSGSDDDDMISLCSLGFLPVCAGKTQVELVCAELYLRQDGNVTERSLSPASCRIDTTLLVVNTENGDDDARESEDVPVFVGYQSGVDGRLRFVGGVQSCERVGFEVYTVDITGGRVHKFDFLCSALREDLSGSALLPSDVKRQYFYACELPICIGDGDYFLDLRPYAVMHGERIVGERHFYLVRNGVLIYLGK